MKTLMDTSELCEVAFEASRALRPNFDAVAYKDLSVREKEKYILETEAVRQRVLQQERAVQMREALESIIEYNQTHARDQYGDASKCESWACVRKARKALGQQPASGEKKTMSKAELDAAVELTTRDHKGPASEGGL